MRSVNLVTPPSVEPVTLDDLHLFLRLNPESDGTFPDDPLLAGLNTAARTTVEGLLNRTLITTTWAATLDSFPCAGGYYNRAARQSGEPFAFLGQRGGEIRLPRPPFQSIVAITYLDVSNDLQVLTPSLFRVASTSNGPARLVMQGVNLWPLTFATASAVTITYTAGYGPDPSAVPEAIKLAIKLLVQAWFYPPDGGPPSPSGIPPFVEAILAPFDWGGAMG